VSQERQKCFEELLGSVTAREKLGKVGLVNGTSVEEGAKLVQEVLTTSEVAAFGAAKEQRKKGKENFRILGGLIRNVNKLGDGWERSLARDDSAVLEELRKKYRAIIRRKKRLHNKGKTAQLVEIAIIRNLSKFRKRFKKRLQQVKIKGKAEQWYADCKGT
jgi:hypothetical protein